MALSDIDVDDIRQYDAKEFTAIEDSQIQFHIDRAIDMTEQIFDGRQSTISVIEGNRDHFTELLTAHRITLIEGGDAQSENSVGGDANYSIVQGNVDNYLEQTKWGREASQYIDHDESTGVVRWH